MNIITEKSCLVLTPPHRGQKYNLSQLLDKQGNIPTGRYNISSVRIYMFSSQMLSYQIYEVARTSPQSWGYTYNNPVI